MFNPGFESLASFLWALPEGCEFTVQIFNDGRNRWEFMQMIDFQTREQAIAEARLLASTKNARVVKLSRYADRQAHAPAIHSVVKVYPCHRK